MGRLTGLGRDLVHAIRSLARVRAFTAVCVLTLGIGMAPVIVIQLGARFFTTPPPGVHTKAPTELVELVTRRVGEHAATDKWSYPDFVAIRDASPGVSIAGWAPGKSAVTVPASGLKTTSKTMYVSSEYFRTIGVSLARGAGFQAPGDAVAILAHAFWQKRLASDPDILGKTIDVDGVPYVVAGIAADRFGGHLAHEDPVELFLPLERYLAVAGANALFDRSKTWVHIHGRLLPGVSIAQADAAMSALTSQLSREHQATNEFVAGAVAPYHAIGNVEGSELPIVRALLTTMTSLLLLVVCLNVSGMVQMRSAMRERELSIRQAIGASRGRLMQHLLAEAVVLAALGCALAVFVLFNGPSLVSWWLGEPIPAQFEEAFRIDLRMLAICAGLSLTTSLVFGWLPAVRFSRPAFLAVLKDDAGTGGIRAGRFHRVTAALQVAIAVPLLIVSFVSLERFRAMAAADLGFACDLLYAAPLEIEARAGGPAESRIRRVRESLASAAGVAAVTVADGLPLDSGNRSRSVATQPDAGAVPRTVNVHVTRVGDGYLETMGIALARGRGFTRDDAAGAAMVTIVSRALAEKLFPDADALGQRLTFGSADDQNRPPQTLTIVGVTADFPASRMSAGREQLLLPLAQHSGEADRGGRTTVMLVARGAMGEPPEKLQSAVEHAIREVEPDFDRRDIVTGVRLRRNGTADFMNQFAFFGIPGCVTLLLSALGIYGVVGLMVATRTREIAVRVALGASRLQVIGMVLFDVVKLAAPGVAVGLVLTAVIVRADGGVTISAAEPLAYVAGAAIAILTAVAASLAPARRAASVQPMVAMRST
jgi:putative ABC transport system permease protein